MSHEEKIREYGQKRETEKLQAYVCAISLEDIVNLVDSRIGSADFKYTWPYILQGLIGSNSHRKLFEVVIKILKELEKNDYSSSHCNVFIQNICMELPKFKTEHLLCFCDFCLECLQLQRVSKMSWKDLLPELLNVLSDKNHLEYNEESMTGEEFRHQIINTMCTFNWFPSNVTSLTEMFTDMSLTKEEHHQVVNKLSKYLEKMTPQEIPAFVYQLLRLCKQNNSRILFIKLQQYFSLRYNNTLGQETDSDRTDIDCIEDASSHDTFEAESTVLFHIHNSASLGEECVKDYLNFLKNLLRAPEFIVHPFQLSVLFTISNISHYEERIFDLIRACISKIYNEEQKKNVSAWFREMVPSTHKIDSVFAQIINDSAEDRELILQALVNFAFVLLGVGSSLGRDLIAEKQWKLGNIILLKIIKRKRHSTPIILEQLSNRIITENSVTQYIECLYYLSINLPYLMVENKSLIINLMEALVQIPGNNAKQLLDAIVPLTKISPTIRDHFILLLRKALYSRNTETRQVAVIGFLKILRNLQISNSVMSSQSSFGSTFSSGHSIFTQMSMNRCSQNSAPSAFSNEALCLEVLSILKRCFMQQAEVRVQLYAGLYNSVCLNPELGVPILDTLWMHFKDYYKIDEEILPPLDFEKITVTRDVTVYLQEPLGNLIYTLGLITVNVAKNDPENETVIKFQNILDSLCKRMINCELVHFELDDGTDLTDIMPEAQHKLLILKEAITVYEALIGYKFHGWELESEDFASQINNLFQGYSRLSHSLKGLGKAKKTEKRKKETNKTTQSIVNTTLKKDGQKSLKNTKVPDTILGFETVIKMLTLLHSTDISWATVPEANLLKSKKDFHQHTMQATFTLVNSLKNKKVIEVQVSKTNCKNLCDIATLLYDRIIKRLTDFLDFDSTTAVLATETFLLILNIVSNSYASNFHTFLTKIGGWESDEDFITVLTEITKIYEKLFEFDDDESSPDPKLSLAVINTLNFLAHQVPTSSNALSLQLLEWLKSYAVDSTIENRPVAQAFFTLLMEFHVKFKVSLTLVEQISARIGDITGVINEDASAVEEFKVLNELTINNIFLSLTASLKSVLDDIDWIIARLKAEYTIVNYPGEDDIEKRQESLKNRERGVCCQLCFIVTIITNLSNCTVPPGNLSEAILKNVTSLYNTLTSLTKYFALCSSKLNPVFERARFERVIKLAGKQLAPVVYKLITYIEESQRQDQESTQKTKKKTVDTSTLKSKVLKETRLIPKVVYEIEQFSKFVMSLSKKTKIDLSKYLGQGTVRDFRIVKLKEVLEKTTAGPSQIVTQESEEPSIATDESESEDEPPSKKRNVDN